MSKKDVSPVLKELSDKYDFQETPEVIVKLQEFMAEISRIINDFLKALKFPSYGDANTSAFSDVLQLVVVVLGVLCLIAVSIAAFRRMSSIKEKSKLEFKGADEIEEELDSKGWRKRADELASNNNWSKACRALYLSVLYMFDEKEILTFTPTRSNYEYWYALSSKKTLQGGFRELADLVDLIWFGEYTATNGDYRTCLDLTKRLNEASLGYAKRS